MVEWQYVVLESFMKKIFVSLMFCSMLGSADSVLSCENVPYKPTGLALAGGICTFATEIKPFIKFVFGRCCNKEEYDAQKGLETYKERPWYKDRVSAIKKAINIVACPLFNVTSIAASLVLGYCGVPGAEYLNVIPMVVVGVQALSTAGDGIIWGIYVEDEQGNATSKWRRFFRWMCFDE
jgi:hypothetical protein